MNRLAFVIGLAFGFVLAASKLNDYNVIHDMLRFREPDVYLILASAVAVAMPLLWLLQKRSWTTPLGGRMQLVNAKVERKTIFGAMAFGTGWAVTGACPGPALAMATGGTFVAVFVVAGFALGAWMRNEVAGGGLFQGLPNAIKRRVGVAR